MAEITVEQAIQTALAFQQMGQRESAERLYRQVLAVDPGRVEVWRQLGIMLEGMGRHADAAQALAQAVALAPEDAALCSDLGVAYRHAGQTEQAVHCYHRALALQENSPGTYFNLSEALVSLGRYEEAIIGLRRAVELKPDFSEAYNNLGSALSTLGAWEEAIASYRRALEINRQLEQAHSNLGRALTESGRYEEAIASVRRALQIEPDSSGAFVNLGHALFRGGRFEDALGCYREWVARRPENATAHRSLGHVLLFLGRYEEGWKEFQWRDRDPQAKWVHRDFSRPLWDGRPMPGETLLLHAEQGLGDTIHFVRYLPLVLEKAGAARVILECPQKLVHLLRESSDPAIDIVPREQATLPPFDRHCSLMSLPFVMGHYEPLSMMGSYLRAGAPLRAVWRDRLGAAARRRVGLAWAGSRTHVNDRRRSMPASLLRPLFEIPGVEFYSLQVEPAGDGAETLREAGMIDLTSHLGDFTDSAALVSELDLVISVDTAVIHLAGALGKPVWTLLPFSPDWRWGPRGEKTPWYPSMRLFRQETPGDWEGVVRRVAAELCAPH